MNELAALKKGGSMRSLKVRRVPLGDRRRRLHQRMRVCPLRRHQPARVILFPQVAGSMPSPAASPRAWPAQVSR
jgi:hypothetical protein